MNKILISRPKHRSALHQRSNTLCEEKKGGAEKKWKYYIRKREAKNQDEERGKVWGEQKIYKLHFHVGEREKRSEDDTENFSLLAAAAACLLKFCNIFLSMQKLLRFVWAPFDFYSFTFCVREWSLLLLLRIYWFSTQTFALPPFSPAHL